MNARTKKPNLVPISTRKPKSQAKKSVATSHKKTFASKTTTQKSKSYYRMLHEKTSKARKWWIERQCPSGTVRFGNDQFALILGYGDLVQGNITINMVYYVKGLNHNLFSVGQYCDADLKVAFRKSTLSHLNFDYINLLSKKDVVIGFPKLKYVKDQLCSSCEVSKGKRSSFKTKTVPCLKGRLNLLHMDLCGPMRVASINGKNYILVIINDYSRYSWTLLGTEFLNKTLHAFFKEEGTEHQTSTPRTPEQNGIVKRQNRTLVKAARTMLSASKLHLYNSSITTRVGSSFGPLYDEFFNVGTSSVNKSSSPTNNSTQQNTLPLANIHPTSEPSTPTNVHAEENNDNQAEDEFTNPFFTQVREVAESSSRNIDPKMCMFALTVSIAKPKTIKEAMADFAWIEAMQEELHRFDRLQVWELIDKPFSNNAKYALEILKKHGMEKGQSIGTPMATKPKLDADLSGKLVDHTDYNSKIRSLVYFTSNRPNIVPADFAFELTAFLDADHVGCIDTRKSTSGGIQFLGDKLVSWMSKKQDCAAMSSAEAEYVALSTSCAQVIWMRTQLKDYGFNYNKIPLYYDSQTDYQLADMFTKALPEDRFQYLVRQISMRCLTPAELEVLANEFA
nr:hypothetical protein [Tanacetum cinerariifolium]